MKRGNVAHRAAAPELLLRSADSVAFEAFWHGLRHGKPMPCRDDFRPGQAVRFLRDLVLLETPAGASALRVRLVGTSFEARAGKSIVGHDYLEFVPRDFHHGVLTTTRLMHEQPCGLWQVMPIHYEASVAQEAEITAFPLSPSQNGIPMIIVLVRFPGRPVSPIDVAGKAMIVDTATQYEFIDVGAGLPAYYG